MMKVTQIYFSPTGNSKAYAQAVAGGISENSDVIDLTPYSNRQQQKSFANDELVIFAFPVYGGRVPKIAKPRFEGFKGDNTPCILVATYGNRDYDDALAEMEDMLTSQGFTVIGGAAVVGRHTYGQIAVERPDKDDLAKTSEFAREAARKMTAVKMPGNRPYKDGGNGGSFYPSTSDKCTGCGLCRKGCPAGAIDDKFQVDESKCISCFRCVRECPVEAKQVDTKQYSDFAAMFTQKLSARRENQFFC